MGLKLAENFFHLERKLGLAKKSNNQWINELMKKKIIVSHTSNTQSAILEFDRTILDKVLLKTCYQFRSRLLSLDKIASLKPPKVHSKFKCNPFKK